VTLGLMTGKVALKTATWDYPQLAAGIKNPGAAGVAGVAAAPSTSARKPAFDATKTQKSVERQIATELNTWQEAGSLYVFEIYFAPSQSAFSATQYADAFKKALEISQTFGGALVVIEGHNSPDALNQAKQQNKSATEQSMIEQAAKNLSLNRAQAVRKAYLDFARAQKLAIDESQFVAVGIGVKSPKYAVPATEQQWNENRRVVFRIKAVETELESFRPPVK
jgi:outer membrane protein OmpA-like peptidoglycan-associated protein